MSVARSLLVCLVVLFGIGLVHGARAAEPVRIFAAASLKNGLDETIATWQAKSRKQATAVYAASSALAKQIEQGAPADVFVSADLDWMDYLDQRKLTMPDTRAKFLGNKLVLIAAANSNVALSIGQNFPLAQALGNNRLAMADPAAVPAGKYGKAALDKLGVWASVAS